MFYAKSFVVVFVIVLFGASQCVRLSVKNGAHDSVKFGRVRDAVFQRNHPNATRKLPGAIIIGVKKAGTRALLEYLRIHPDIRASGPEVHFFDKNYDRGLEWYRQMMPLTSPGQLTMEKTPSYFITEEAPKRIYDMNKHTKLILVVRDPVTRVLSDYAQAVDRHPRMKSFEYMAFRGKDSVNTAWSAIKIGLYAKYLQKWLNYFPKEQIQIVHGEEMIYRPAKIITRVQDFLGVPRVINEQHFVFNSTKGFPCLIKKKSNVTTHCLDDTKGRRQPKVKPISVKRLRRFYRKKNAEFYKLTGRNFFWP